MHNPVRSLADGLAGAATHDFCPWANRFVYWMKQPIAAISLAMAAALAFAIFVRPVAAVAFVALSIVAALGYAWPWIAVRGLSATLRFPATRVTEGDPTTAVLEVTNAWPWPVWGLAVDSSQDGADSVALAHVRGRTTAEFAWTIHPRVRGEYPQWPPRLVSGFPFGLRHVSKPVEVGRRLLVWPRIVPLDTLLDAAETRPADELCSEVRAGESGDISGTRPFRDGDSLRRVHWAQTARMGGLVVSERQAAIASAMQIVVDPTLPMDGVGPESTWEWSIRIAASIAAAYQRQHAAIVCRCGNKHWRLAHGDVGLRRFLDSLSRFQPQPPDATAHLARPLVIDNGMFTIVITSQQRLAAGRPQGRRQGDGLWLVIQRQGDGEALLHPPQSRRQLPLSFSADADGLAAFERVWRRQCRVG